MFNNSVPREQFESERERRITAEVREAALQEQVLLLKDQLKSSNERELQLISQLAQPKPEAESKPPARAPELTADEIMRIPAHTKHGREARSYAALTARLRDADKNGGESGLTEDQKQDVRKAMAQAAGAKE